ALPPGLSGAPEPETARKRDRHESRAVAHESAPPRRKPRELEDVARPSQRTTPSLTICRLVSGALTRKAPRRVTRQAPRPSRRNRRAFRVRAKRLLVPCPQLQSSTPAPA